MGKIQEQYPQLSIRRNCGWLRHRRASIYSRRKKKPELEQMESDEAVVEMMKKVRREHRPWGFRLIYRHLRMREQKISRHRAYRLYQKSRMSLHRKPPTKAIGPIFLDGLLLQLTRMYPIICGV